LTLQTEPALSRRGLSFRAFSAIAYGVVHGSALYVFLTFAMGVNGVEFFYFYPQEAQTMLRPFGLLAIVWLAAAGFSVLGLITLGLRTDRAGRRVTRRQLWAVILGASIALILILVEAILFQYPVPFWWMGTVAVGICWLGFGDGIVQIIGGRRKLIWAFLASLLGIGAIVEIWSLSHWLYSGFIPLAGYGKTWPDLEMNLTYAWSSLFPAIFLATWLSPIWAFIVVKLYRMANRRRPVGSQISESPQVQQIKLGLDDFILLLVLILTCVVIGFYPYFHDPSWLVGTDAFWRYKDPLDRVAGSPNVLAAASNERHGLYLLILYGIMSVTGLSPFDMVKVSPMILAALLSALTYVAVTRFRGSRTEGFFAGFLSATTFPTTLGIFASIHANWFTLSVGLVALSILISLGQTSKRALWKALLATLCGIVLLILHPWTWGIVALSALAAGLVFLAKKNWKMFAASLTVLLSGLVSGALVFAAGSDTEKAKLIETVTNFAGPLRAPSLIEHPFGVIYDAFRVWSPFLNPLLMVLAIVGVVLLVRERASNYKAFMLSWMAVAGIGTFFAVTLETEIWRIWYLQPLWLLGATGIRGLLQMSNSTWSGQASYLGVARTAAILGIAGLAVFLLDPAVGSAIFYVAALSIVLIHLGGQRASTKTVLVSAFVLFVLVFFLNHALRSLYPLILDPHNFLEH
jgi:hypothetical protein